MVPPTASVPASGETSGLNRRKTHTGTIDGQGQLLVHPMTWLDERLFGWSRSTRRGTSAWGGYTNASSRAASGPASPDVSDDEDHGDYDNVINYLPSIVGDAITGLGFGKVKTPRSARGSFADSPSVKRAEGERAARLSVSHQSGLNNMYSPRTPGTASGWDNLSPLDTTRTPRRSQPPSPTLSTHSGGVRRRKMSLTGAVPVTRIGQLDRTETFEEATDQLNQENEQKRKGQ
jgi:glycerol-3-phosphate O-acyltransferase/dihydroxyacetone phosphate acyltransferase